MDISLITSRGQASDALWRLHSILGRFRWGVFVLAVVAGVYARQTGLLDTLAVVRLYGLAVALGIIAAGGEYLRRTGAHRRAALLLVGLGDWAVAVVVAAFGPQLLLEFPFIFLVPIVTTSSALNALGGSLIGLLSALALVAASWQRFGDAGIASALLWGIAFVVGGGVGGYVGRQWERAQQHVEAMYRWLSALGAATTLEEVGAVVLQFLTSLVVIKGRGSGGSESAVALLVSDGDDRFSALIANGLLPDVRARLRVSTRDGLLQWVVKDGRPIWLAIGTEDGLHIPAVAELDRFRSCLIVPIGGAGQPLALGMALSEATESQGDVEADVVTRFTEQAAVALRKAMVYSHMERQAEAMATVLDKTRYGGAADTKEVFRWVVEKAGELVRPDAVAAAVLDKEQRLVTVSIAGEDADALVSAEADGELAPTRWVIERRAPLAIADYRQDARFGQSLAKPFASVIVVPLRIEDEVFGVLAAGSKHRANFNQNDLMMLMILGQQLAVALQESRLQFETQELRLALSHGDAIRVEGMDALMELPVGHLQSRVEDIIKEVRAALVKQDIDHQGDLDREALYKRQVVVFAEELHKLYEVVQEQAREIDDARLELEQSQVDTVMALVKGLESNYPFLQSSGQEVARLATAMAIRLGAEEKEIQDLYYAALLREVGLVGMLPDMLGKPELDAKEMAMVRRHSTIGRNMLASFPFLTQAAIIVERHHERWDGSGYPNGVAGKNIPLSARILAVADSYEALTSNRSYRAALSGRDAIDTIKRLANSQFDPNVVDVLIDLLKERRDVAAWALGKTVPTVPET